MKPYILAFCALSSVSSPRSDEGLAGIADPRTGGGFSNADWVVADKPFAFVVNVSRPTVTVYPRAVQGIAASPVVREFVVHEGKRREPPQQLNRAVAPQ